MKTKTKKTTASNKKTASITICAPYDRIFTTKDTTIIMYSPRISGKSIGLGYTVFVYANAYPNHDIIVTRANYNSLEDSMYNEILDVAEQMGLKHFYIPRKAPLRIKTIRGNTIYFKGIGGSDYSRSKGFKIKRKLSLIICDETQQLKDEQSLLQAKATFIRQLDDQIPAHVIFAGNPESVKGHWWNVYCRRERFAGNNTFIDANYLSIWRFLSQYTRDEIETMRITNPPMYKFLYLGNIDDLAGGAYPQFKRERHYISHEEFERETSSTYLEYIIWGGDGAVTHDATGICPIGIYSDGRGFVLPRFYYDPLITGVVLAPSQIVDLILKYVDDLDQRFHITDDGVGSCFYIDCAAADLITQLRYEIDDYHGVKGYSKKNIINNNATVNNCFARDMIKIVDYGGYYDYYNDTWVETTVDSEPLVYQLEAVVWKNYKYDPIIKNDYTDALTYGTCAYFENPDNLNLPEKKGNYRNGRNEQN